MTGRYVYTPMTSRRLGRRVTLIERIRRSIRRRKAEPDLFPIVGYYAPVFPGK